MDEEKKGGFAARMKERFKGTIFDSHYRIERFGVLFCVFFTALVSIMCLIGVKISKEDHEVLSDRVLYTETVSFSKTGVKGYVEGVWVDSAHTQAFVLVKMSDMTYLPTDVSKYQMFLTGTSLDAEPTRLNVNPTGRVYLFGSTGYIGFYLHEPKGFEAQILDLTIRNNEELVQGAGAAVGGDGSFAKFDQMRIYLNPGGAAGVVGDFLESGDMSPAAIYEETVTRPLEADARESLTQQLETLYYDMRQVSEYARRVMDDGIRYMDPPDPIKGDVMRDHDGNVLASLDPRDETGTKGASTVLYLDSVQTAGGGVDFHWQDGSILDGYIDALRGELSAAQFMSQVRTSPASTFNTAKMAWSWSDGTPFVYDTSVGVPDDAIVQASNDITTLENAWRQYWTDKQAYQKNGLMELLNLESKVLSSDRGFTVRDDEGTLINWQSK